MRRSHVLSALVVAVLSVVLWVLPAFAQRSGGSFGGGHFGGGSHSSGGGGGSFSGSSGGFGGHSSNMVFVNTGGGGYSSSSSDSGPGSMICFLIGVVLFIVIANAASKRGGSGLDTGGNVDVTAISLALDWRARPEIQATLDKLARSGDTSTPAGLAALLHETIIAVRRQELSWLYAGVVNTPPITMNQAEALFGSVASEMRSRFKVEVVRNEAGQIVQNDLGEMKAKSSEGAGVVVVTIVVAAYGNIPDIAQATNASELRQQMKVLGAMPASELIAFEVIWSPAADADRMSTMELETFYPELKQIDETTVAGRVFCGYCAAPFAAELARCPHCGGPASDAKKA